MQWGTRVARFAVETAAKYAKYGMRPETIGGAVELAAITKHEGFKWVARKHLLYDRIQQGDQPWPLAKH